MRIAELDGLRGIAILGVLAVHSYGAIVGGWLGIDLFFVLSGYLITSALRRDGSLLRFYGRRISRIWPPLAGTIVLAYVIAPGFQLEPLAYLYSNFIPPRSMGSLAHTWYLSIEEQFYLLWPLAFLFLRRGRTLAFVIVAAWVMHVWMVLNGADYDTIHRSTFSRMDALAVGCGLALVRPAIGKTVAAAALAVIGVAFFAAKPEPVTVALGLALFPLACAGVIGGSQHLRLLRFRPLVYFGERSWGIYLYHYPIFCALAIFQDTHHRAEWFGIAVLKVVLSVAVAELSYRTIERWSQSIDFRRLFPDTDSDSTRASP